MASVPNTNTFKLTDVTAVVGGSSLSVAFASSVDACFDPTYKGSKNSLLNFRNYDTTRGAPVNTLFNAPNGVTSTKIIIETNWTSAKTITARGFWYNTTGFTLTGMQVVQTAATGFVSANVTGLTPNQSYYFTAYCTNADGTTTLSFGSTISTMPSSSTFTSYNGSWTVPARCISVTIECWGGGGTGGAAQGNAGSRAGGGSGGCYAKAVVAVTPGWVCPVYAPAANPGNASTGADGSASYVLNPSLTTLCQAMGGKTGVVASGTSSTGGVASTTGCVGSTIYAGGNGGAGTVGGASGGGGGGAGSTGAGNAGSAGTPGAAKSNNGGAGGAGVTTNAAVNAGASYGGGGSGGLATGTTDTAGGNGGAGYVMLSFP